MLGLLISVVSLWGLKAPEPHCFGIRTGVSGAFLAHPLHTHDVLVSGCKDPPLNPLEAQLGNTVAIRLEFGYPKGMSLPNL